MGLIWTDDEGVVYSTGDMSKPVETVLNGTRGDVVEKSYILKSDDNTLYYQNVYVTMENPHEHITYEFALDSSGLPGQYSDSIMIEQVDDTGVRVWFRKSVDPNTPVATYTDAKISIDALELKKEGGTQ